MCVRNERLLDHFLLSYFERWYLRWGWLDLLCCYNFRLISQGAHCVWDAEAVAQCPSPCVPAWPACDHSAGLKRWRDAHICTLNMLNNTNVKLRDIFTLALWLLWRIHDCIMVYIWAGYVCAMQLWERLNERCEWIVIRVWSDAIRELAWSGGSKGVGACSERDEDVAEFESWQ
jgi:hypothetical protein